AFAATLTPERWSDLDGQALLLGRLCQVRSLECGILQFLGRLDEALLDTWCLQLTHQLVLHAVETRHIGSLDAEQLDQVPAELAAYRGRNLAILQRIQGLLESRVIDTLAGIAKIATTAGRTRVLGHFPG